MKRPILIPIVLLALAVAALALLALVRLRQARQLSQPCTVHAGGSTNYVAQILETTVGRTDTSYLVIVAVRLQNPNPFAVTLARKGFLLVDSRKEHYEPSTTGTQTVTIELPAGGAVEHELLSYAVPAEAFQGRLAVQLGPHDRLLIKEPKLYQPHLAPGRFVTFHRRDW